MVGGTADVFWRSTPRQIQSSLKAIGERFEREYNDRMSLAWHIAALTRYPKKLPRLQTLMAKKPRAAHQTWQEQMMIMDQWVRATRHFPPSKRHVVN